MEPEVLPNYMTMPEAGQGMLFLRGTKRKASCVGDVKPSQSTSPTYPPIQPKSDSLERLELIESSSMTATERPGHQLCSSSNRLGDVDYNSIPDYAPPTSTLPTDNPHILQVHWPPKPFVDLSNDPDRHMLHEAELQLVTSLNLNCAKYLCTKRRIFQARLSALLEGRAFLRADCQNVCKIDANKVSKICGAFDKVGWFDKEYFLSYLDENNSPSNNTNDNSKNICTSSSDLSELDIWEVSESEFHVTSEEDEESVDGDTGDSSVSFDGRHEESRDLKSLDPYPDLSLSKQNHGPSHTGRDESQESVRNNEKDQISKTLSRNETVDEGPKIESRTPSPGLVSQEKLDHGKPTSFSTDDTGDFPLLETRSMTQQMKRDQNRSAENQCASLSTFEAKNGQQMSGLNKPDRGGTPSNDSAQRIRIPRSLEEANAADVMLVKMKQECRPWLEIEKAIEKQTGKAQATTSLSCRYTRIMRKFAKTRVKTDKRLNKVRPILRLRIEPDKVSELLSTGHLKSSSLKQDQLLLAAEAEVESKFQQEKAHILAEIESNYQSEKWGMVAEAMSRAGPATYSAELVQAQHERLTARPQKAVAKDKIDRDTSIDLPPQTPRAVGRENLEMPTASRSSAGILDEASNAIDTSADGTERGHQKVRKFGPQNHAEHSERMRKVWAKRRALGTDGLYGGLPEASTIAKRAKIAASTTAPGAETSSPAPAISHSSGHARDASSKANQPIVLKIGRDANKHKLSLAQIIPAATPPADTEPKPNKPPSKVSTYQAPKPQNPRARADAMPEQHGAKRQHTCQACGTNYVNQSEHYRIFPKVGSEHRRQMAANHAAAETPLAS